MLVSVVSITASSETQKRHTGNEVIFLVLPGMEMILVFVDTLSRYPLKSLTKYNYACGSGKKFRFDFGRLNQLRVVRKLKASSLGAALHHLVA